MRLHQSSFNPTLYRGWIIKISPTGLFTARSPDFELIETTATGASWIGGFASAHDRMALLGEIDAAILEMETSK